MTSADYAAILLAMLVTGIAIPLLLRVQGDIFGLPAAFWGGFLLIVGAAAMVWGIRRAFA